MSNIDTNHIIRFAHLQFRSLRQIMLNNQDKEHFAVLLAKTEQTGENIVIHKIIETRHLPADRYQAQTLAYLSPDKEFIFQLLAEIQQRDDVDTLIDVHTHPFCEKEVSFSSMDDDDEDTFSNWLFENFEEFYYGSIVLSQTDYSARFWVMDEQQLQIKPAVIKTQTKPESIPCSRRNGDEVNMDIEHGPMARTSLAIGVNVLKTIMTDQTVTVIGVGGLGSLIAENLLHMGFQKINLVDHDTLEVTNLNRVAGATYEDAVNHQYKVHVVHDHLKRINPQADIQTFIGCIESEALLPVIANSDWLIVGTDSHSSRFFSQKLSMQFAVPMISSGVNISVREDEVIDVSGEIITCRYGDEVCLNCLGRISQTQIAAELHREEEIGKELVRRGYVQGADIKEPAVKTLNSIVAAATVDILINQYTKRQPHHAVVVYENNLQPVFYIDRQSVDMKKQGCFYCSLSQETRSLPISAYENLPAVSADLSCTEMSLFL